MDVKVMQCVKVPEKEFDKDPRMDEGWREDFRKDGFVYIVYDPKKEPPESIDSWNPFDAMMELRK